MSAGHFITFEGLDGSGKTTQLRRLQARLERMGYEVVSLRQPGGTVLGDRIRGVLLDSKSEEELGGIAPAAEMALMFADRAQSLAQIVKPALVEGRIVLCDRYTDSSEAYQGAGRGLGAERVREMHRVVCDDIQPELTVLLLPPIDGSLARARRRNERNVRSRGMDENRFEREGEAFYRRVYAQYQEIARRETKRVAAIESEAGLAEVEALVWAVVERIL